MWWIHFREWLLKHADKISKREWTLPIDDYGCLFQAAVAIYNEIIIDFYLYKWNHLETHDLQSQKRSFCVIWFQDIANNSKLGAWWRHQMETFSASLAIYAGNSPVPGEFPAQRPVTRSFDVFFDLRLNKRLTKQSWGWWFETLSRPLWRHRNGMTKTLLTSQSTGQYDVCGPRWHQQRHIYIHVSCSNSMIAKNEITSPA